MCVAFTLFSICVCPISIIACAAVFAASLFGVCVWCCVYIDAVI